MRNIFYYQLSKFDFEFIQKLFKKEMYGLDFMHPIRTLEMDATISFFKNEFGYDGATFVKERFQDTVFELASFIHDWRNSKGYVGKHIDDEFLDIMIVLNYPANIIVERYLLMRSFTWLNVLRHKIKGTYKKEVPTNIFNLKKYHDENFF